MTAVVRPRGGGKTRYLIDELAKAIASGQSAVLLVPSNIRKQHLIQEYPWLKDHIEAYAEGDLRKHMRGRSCLTLVDDVDDLLNELFGNVPLFSYSTNDKASTLTPPAEPTVSELIEQANHLLQRAHHGLVVADEWNAAVRLYKVMCKLERLRCEYADSNIKGASL